MDEAHRFPLSYAADAADVPIGTVRAHQAAGLIPGKQRGSRGWHYLDYPGLMYATTFELLAKANVPLDKARSAAHRAMRVVVDREPQMLAVPLEGTAKLIPKASLSEGLSDMGEIVILMDCEAVVRRLHEMFPAELKGIAPSIERQEWADDLMKSGELDGDKPISAERKAEHERLMQAERLTKRTTKFDRQVEALRKKQEKR